MSDLATYDAAQLLAEIFRTCLSDSASMDECLARVSAPIAVTEPSPSGTLGRVLRVNPPFAKLLGQDPAEVIGLPLSRFNAQADVEDSEALADKLKDHGHCVMALDLTLANDETLRVERTVMRVPAWGSLETNGDVLIAIDRALESIAPAAGGADLSQSQQIALQLETLLRRYIRENYRQGMHPAQWSALRYFKLAPPNARSLTGFARAHHTTMGTASTTVSTLVGKGYLEKHSFRGAVNLTKDGEALLRDDPLSSVIVALNRMSAIERDWAEYVLTTLTDSFGASGER